ncbi:MAG: porin [Alphaproteobacteria bacterium]|nr:porin [Alphaproteobacteria bacterium]
MKRVLLASTALCLGAGTAFAQDMGMADDGMMMDMAPTVTIGGNGRMGVVSNTNEDLVFSSRVRVVFTLAKELDNGLSAGGSIRADNASGGASGTGGNIYLSGPFGKLAMGDLDSAAKSAVGNVDGVGYTEVGDAQTIEYLRGDKTGSGEAEDPTLLYTLPKMGPVSMFASIAVADVVEEGEVQAGRTEISADTLSFGAKADLSIADMGKAWISGGFEATPGDNEDGHLVFGAGASMSGFTGKVVAGSQSRDANADGEDQDREQFAISAGYSAGQMGVTVFYAESDFRAADEKESLGAGFSWSLGGGASLKAGFTNWPAQTEGAEDKQAADLGVTFAF